MSGETATTTDPRESPVPIRFVSVPDAAAALSIAETKCWELVSSGQIRSVKVGRRRLIPVHALDEFVERTLQEQST